MPKNKGKGGKKVKRGKGGVEEGRPLQLAMKECFVGPDGKETTQRMQVYAQVEKILGGGRLTANCFDGKQRMCIICGKMWKKQWVGVSDIVLVSLRSFQDDKADVILRYSSDEARQLQKLNELPDSTNINNADSDGEDENDTGFVFEDI